MKERELHLKRAFSLIEILIVMVVIMVIAAYLLPHYLGGKTMDGKKVRAPITMARDTVCQSNIQQVRQSLEINKTTDAEGGYPSDLASLKLPAECLKCEVGGEAYVYDPQTGKVHCPHPGHESY
jgi:prepilin-type N-terminal cleavage/methylation domain-containing protein